jgi:hypothetical protein
VATALPRTRMVGDDLPGGSAGEELRELLGLRDPGVRVDDGDLVR